MRKVIIVTIAFLAIFASCNRYVGPPELQCYEVFMQGTDSQIINCMSTTTCCSELSSYEGAARLWCNRELIVSCTACTIFRIECQKQEKK